MGTVWQRGFNLIEAAIVLGVVGLVIGGIWVAASAVSEELRLSRTVEGVYAIARNTQLAVSSRDSVNFPASITPFLVRSGNIPADWVTGETTASHPFGGDLVVQNASTTQFSINIYDLSAPVCAKLIARLTAVAAQAERGQGSWDANVKRSSLGRVAIFYSDATPYWNKLAFPVSLADASSACTAAPLSFLQLNFGYTRIN